MKRVLTALFAVGLITSLFCVKCVTAKEAPRGLVRSFAGSSLTGLRFASFDIPGFRTAALDTVEDIGQVDGMNLYLCRLKSGEADRPGYVGGQEDRPGYIMVAGSDSMLQVVAMSATAARPPSYFLKELLVQKPKQRRLDLSRMVQVSFISDVPLVASVQTTLGMTEPVELSEVACCVSSILQYLQYEKNMPLFGHTLYFMGNSYVRFLGLEVLGEEELKKVQEKLQTKIKETHWQTFSQEFKSALAQKGIESADKLTSDKERATARIRVRRDIVVPIIRRRLLDPLTAQERFELLQREETAIEHVTRTDLSRGMRDAVLLQEDYLHQDIARLCADVNTFFETRGLIAKITFLSFKDLKGDCLPAVLVGPDKCSGVLLGYVDIGGEKFASVFFPKTGEPRTMTLPEQRRAIRQAHGIREPNESDEETQKALEKMREAEARLHKFRQEKGLPEPQGEDSAEKRMREGLARFKAAEGKMTVVEDKVSKFPGSLADGVHLVKCACLASWQALYIGEVVPGQNWGISTLREQKEDSK